MMRSGGSRAPALQVRKKYVQRKKEAVGGQHREAVLTGTRAVEIRKK